MRKRNTLLKHKNIKIINKAKYQRKFRLKKNKLPLIILILFIVILTITIIIYRRRNEEPDIIKHKKRNKIPGEIMYKGDWIFPSVLFNQSLSKISDKYIKYINKEKIRFEKYFYLEEYDDEPTIKNKLKNKLLEKISEIRKQNTTQITTFFLSRINPFGNNLNCINNAIFYCEILGCNKIILQENNIKRRWLIKEPVYIEKLNITIMQGPKVACNESDILCCYETWDLLYPIIIKPDIRTQYIKDEILRNLPNVTTKPDDLYMHIRGGDIFSYLPLNVYMQPPLCFYEKVIKRKKFKNIYLISQDNLNVVVDPLIKKYPKIIFNKNDLETDISLLAHAYHIACSIGSFTLSAIKINNNLKEMYEYDIGRLPEKFIWLHPHLFKFDIKYRIYTMKPSDIYASEMFYWEKTDLQKQLMLNDTCPYDFTLTYPN